MSTVGLGLFLTASLASLLRVRSRRENIGFIFDLDGTLIDFETASHQALNKPVQRFGKQVDWSLHAQIVGKKRVAWTQQLLETLEIPQEQLTAKQYGDEWHLLVAESFHTMPKMPGALEFVRRIRSEYPQAKLAIATSSERANVQLKMSYHQELLDMFQVVVTGDEVTNGKPAPDIFLLAAQRIGVSPSKCIVVEDSPFGVQGGVAAGCYTLAIPDDRMVGNENAFTQADIVVKTLKAVDSNMLKGIVATLRTRS